MILEIRAVGRKTPEDGRLEVSEGTWRRIAMDGPNPIVQLGDATGHAALERMPCVCRRGDGHAHEHHFVQCDLFRQLVAGETCVLEIVGRGQLAVARPHPLAG